jgi:RimJ/RimL family protein N-acetyltransferase
MSKSTTLKFTPLTEDLAKVIAPWFDDPDSIRYLGRRDWLYRELLLIQTAPSSEFRGRKVLARHVWVIHDSEGQPCCLVDVEPYDDGTAGMVILVAPHRRNQGLGQQVLRALPALKELRNVHKIVGAVEPDNVQARRCYEQAGYTVADLPDEEGMLRIEKVLR